VRARFLIHGPLPEQILTPGPSERYLEIMTNSLVISLPPDLEQFVSSRLELGEYPSPGEMVREGLRLLREAKTMPREQSQNLDEEIQVGLAQAERGELLDGEEVFREFEKALDSPQR
jgi:antitoxin ParD1/3/4